MDSKQLIKTIEGEMNCQIIDTQHLGVGFGLTGLKAKLDDGRQIAIKHSTQHDHNLLTEGFMLKELNRQSSLPVPEILLSNETTLVMTWIDGNGIINKPCQQHAAQLLAELHQHSHPYFGYSQDTLIGPLNQPNPIEQNWIDFFSHHRILYMAQQAMQEGALNAKILRRLEKLTEKFDNLLLEPPHPSLLHGDLWTGNIIIGSNQINGVIDPAIYYGHPEIELAFTTLFGTFNKDFFDAYHALSPIEPEFHSTRLEIYNLYPLLVHVRLFGSSYLSQIIPVLDRHGV